MKERSVDIAIIGAGSAGLYALSQVRASGKSFVLINGGPLGTTCARVGCMPSKAMIQVAEDFYRRRSISRYGVKGMERLTIDRSESIEYVQNMRDAFVERVISNSTDKLGDAFIEGYAKFIESHLVEIDSGERIRAKKFIIATGSSPIVPEAWKAFGNRIITTDEFFELETLPDSMGVIGLGVIGLELGQALARVGVQVNGFDLANTIAAITDPKVRQSAIDILGKEFPLHLGVTANISAEKNQLTISTDNVSLAVDKVLVAIGRRPNLESLNLAVTGVQLQANGLPEYDCHSMQIGTSHLFIAGDVNSERQVLHEAGDEGRIAGHNATADRVLRFQRKTPLGIVFTDPNICQVGLRYDQLDLEQTAIGEVQLAPVGRAMIMAKNKGLIRVYANKADARLLGAELVSVKGENLAHLLAWCIQQEMKVGELLQMPFYHPVLEEALQAALYDLYSKVEHKNKTPIKELVPLDS